MEYPQYNPKSDHLPLSDDELMALDEILAELPDGAMNIEALDGYLTALLLSPQDLAALPGAAWLPTIWGGDDAAEGNAPFVSGKQRKKTTLLVLRHLQSIAVQLRDTPQAWEPIFSVAEQEDGSELTDAEDWCVGFLLGADIAGEAWAPLFDDPTFAEVLRPIVLLGADEAELGADDQALLSDPVQRDALSRNVPDVVLALHERKMAS